MKYFDVNVYSGKTGPKHLLEIWKTEDILKVMDQCNVSSALIYSGLSKSYSPLYGNNKLNEELKKSDRLFGCYTLLPEQAGDFPEPEVTKAEIRRNNIAAVKIFPKSHAYFPDERTMGKTFKMITELGLPLIVDSDEITFPELEEILKNHPDLNLILCSLSWGNERKLFPIIKEYKNLHIEFSAFQGNRIIELMCEKFGSKQLLFGSGMPKKSLGAARAFIDYAQISEEDKQNIAYRNLERLTGVRIKSRKSFAGDDIAAEAFEGKPLSTYVFDSHTHFLEEGGKCGNGWVMHDGDIHAMVKLGNVMGVDMSAVAPWLGIWTDSKAGNEHMLKMTRQYPGKVCGYVLIDPNYVDSIKEEAEMYHLKNRIPGMKMFYSRIKTRYNDPMFESWFKLANDNQLFALMDNGGYPQFLDDVEELALKYRKISFFLDHAGSNFDTAVRYAPYAKKHDNIFLQITYTSVTQGVIEYFCREGIANKVLYGTDAPMRDPRPQLGWVVHADISYEDKKKILGENMQKIYNRAFKGQI